MTFIEIGGHQDELLGAGGDGAGHELLDGGCVGGGGVGVFEGDRGHSIGTWLWRMFIFFIAISLVGS